MFYPHQKELTSQEAVNRTLSLVTRLLKRLAAKQLYPEQAEELLASHLRSIRPLLSSATAAGLADACRTPPRAMCNFVHELECVEDRLAVLSDQVGGTKGSTTTHPEFIRREYL